MSGRHSFRLDFTPALDCIVNWCCSFDKSLLLTSNTSSASHKDPYGEYDLIAAAGSIDEPEFHSDPFVNLYDFHREKKDWLFGHLSYEVKDLVHGTTSRNPDRIGFPIIHFFRPRYVLTVKDGDAVIHYLEAFESDDSLSGISSILSVSNSRTGRNSLPIESSHLIHRTPHTSYLEKAAGLLKHIQRGDIYEVNFCIESYMENQALDPKETFLNLLNISPMPFSAYYRFGKKHLMCASPERYLAKRGDKLISQPIKGTIRRGMDESEDQALKVKLKNDPKEISENVMITDLVRNDLSTVAVRGSVAVEELMGLKTFPRIHQLISTVTAKLPSETPWTEAIRHSFPMGSMTGAPKLRALQLIDEFEDSRRGLYSGCVGYVSPEGDFDFNVVIRSIQYDADSGYLSMMVGSALTIGCDPEQEFQECLLKAETMIKALE